MVTVNDGQKIKTVHNESLAPNMSSYLQHNSKIVRFYNILSKISNLERLIVHIGDHDRHDIYVSFTKKFIINSMFEYMRVFVRVCASGLLSVQFDDLF